MFSELDGFLLLDKTVERVLHDILVFHVHLDLVFDPIPVWQVEEILSQAIIVWVHRLIIDDSLLLHRMP